MAKNSLQRNKTFDILLRASILFLLIAIILDNFFYYPSYFNLLYVNDALAEAILTRLDVDPALLMERTNRWVALGISTTLFLCIGTLLSKSKRLERPLYFLLSLIVLLYYSAEWQTHNFIAGYLIEVALQALTIPAVFMFRNSNKKLLFALMLLSAVTFLGHGLFAANIYPRPGYFVDMMSKAFGLTQEMAENALLVIGVVDVLCLLLIFLKPTQKSILVYMIFWGFFTALARPIFNFSTVFLEESLIIWIPEFLKRGTHFLVPLALLIEYKNLPKLIE